jgi:predicted RNase H-like HicB family nuclease
MELREFYVVIERDDALGFVGKAPQLRECKSDGRTIDELIGNMRKAIDHALKDDDLDNHAEFIGVYKCGRVATVKKHEFYVVVEKDEDGYFVGEAPQLRACFSQGLTLEELMENMEEVIGLVLEYEKNNVGVSERFVGVQRLAVEDRWAEFRP